MTPEEKAKLHEILTQAITAANSLVCVSGEMPVDAHGKLDPTKIDPQVYQRAVFISQLFADNERSRRLLRAILKGAIETMGYDSRSSGDPTTVYVLDEKLLFTILTAVVHTGLEVGYKLHELGGRIP